MIKLLDANCLIIEKEHKTEEIRRISTKKFKWKNFRAKIPFFYGIFALFRFCLKEAALYGTRNEGFCLWRISFGLPSPRKRANALRRRCEPDSASLCSQSRLDCADTKKGLRPKGQRSFFGTRNRNRTCNYPLGGGYYIHLTMQAYYLIVFSLVRISYAAYYNKTYFTTVSKKSQPPQQSFVFLL